MFMWVSVYVCPMWCVCVFVCARACLYAPQIPRSWAYRLLWASWCEAITIRWFGLKGLTWKGLTGRGREATLAPRKFPSDQQGQDACVPQCDSLIMDCLLTGCHGTCLHPRYVGAATGGSFEPRSWGQHEQYSNTSTQRKKRTQNFLFTQLSSGKYFLFSLAYFNRGGFLKNHLLTF